MRVVGPSPAVPIAPGRIREHVPEQRPAPAAPWPPRRVAALPPVPKRLSATTTPSDHRPLPLTATKDERIRAMLACAEGIDSLHQEVAIRRVTEPRS